VPQDCRFNIDRAGRFWTICIGLEVGDICGHNLDAGGNTIVHPLAERVINPTLKSLRAIPLQVLAAGGRV
jgi:lsr operon transcriptional repressor